MPDYMPIYYPESAFGGYSNVDSTVAFLLRARSLFTPQSVVLDVGCGRGGLKLEDTSPLRRSLYNHRGACAKVIGIDPDPAGAQSPIVDEFRKIDDLKHWPIESESIDVAIADFVLEHVDDVDAFFSECKRVVKPGGYLCLRTPNVMSYFGIISWLVPNRYHASVAKTAQPERQEMDVFPTLYHCNTRGRLKRKLREFGFDGAVVGFEAEPSYLSMSRILYALGVMHQKLAPQMFKLTLLAFARKAGGPGAA